jgi:hypothetical protein
MDDSSSDFRDTLVELIDGSPRPAEHPSPDQWIAYHRGRLSPDEEALLQEHLGSCRDCFDLAAGAAEFAGPDEEPGAGQDVETTALWRLLRPQLDPLPSNIRPISAAAPKPPSRAFRLPTTVAATFFVALLGMTVWNLQQRSALEASRAPRPNVPTFEFSAGDRAPGERERTAPAGPLRLLFHPAEDLPAYRLTIRDAATGRELYTYEMQPDRDLALSLSLPEGLPPGRYRMELLDGAGKVRETHLLRFTKPSRGGVKRPER